MRNRLHLIKAVYLRICEYYGLTKEPASPLVLKNPAEGKSIHITDAKRAQLLSILQCLPAQEIAELLSRGPTSWEKYSALRMNDMEIECALSEHLRYVRRLDESREKFHRRRMVAGISLIAGAVWLLVIGEFLRGDGHAPGRGGFGGGQFGE